ncbi:glutathione S-transferase [Frigidibacter albus]
MMTLFHTPGSCSDGILLLLEEAGLPYTITPVNLKAQDHKKPEFLRINPKGKVPALVTERGDVLTEFPAICYWLANMAPAERKLWPDTLIEQTHTLSTLDLIVATLHMRGFTLVRVPQRFHSDPGAQEALSAFGRSEVTAGLDVLDRILGEQDYLAGNFGIADCAAFYCLAWAEPTGIALSPRLAAYLHRLRARPAAQRIRASA